VISPLSTPGTAQSLATYRRHSQEWEQSAERLTTGKRINHAKDDPSGLMAVAQLRMELAEFGGRLKGLKGSQQQSQIKESTLSAAQDVLVGLHDVIGAAAGGNLTADQLEVLQQQVDETIDALARLDASGQKTGIAASLSELRTGGSASLSGNLEAASAAVEAAGAALSGRRAAIGAYQRTTVDHMIEFTEDQILIHTDAISQIEDTDYLEEGSKFIRAKILLESTLLTMNIRQKQWADSVQDLLADAADQQDKLQLKSPDELAAAAVA